MPYYPCTDCLTKDADIERLRADLAIIREWYGAESIDGLLHQKRLADQPTERRVAAHHAFDDPRFIPINAKLLEERKPLPVDVLLGGDPTCSCSEPFVKTWTDGRVYCTKCGWLIRATEAVNVGPTSEVGK
jgi:hypothetical protein